MNQTIPVPRAGSGRAPRHELTHDLGFDVTAVRDEGAFAKARRHSRIVRVLRIALPGVVIAGGLAFAVFTWLGSRPTLEFADIQVDPDGVVMQRAQVSGFQDNGQAYRLEAERAIQENANPDQVRLESVLARIGISDDDAADVTAQVGFYDANAALLILSEGITLATVAGMRAELDRAEVDLDAGAVRSDRPVLVSVDGSRIRADAMEILDGGRHMVFRGTVRVTITPSGNEPKAPGAQIAETAPSATPGIQTPGGTPR